MEERSKARICFFLYISTLLLFDTKYPFMILNMFLAFCALEVSFLLPLFKMKNKKELPGSMLIYIIFVLLAPNTLYVITDLIHLNIFRFDYKRGLAVIEWWNFTIMTVGVLLAIFYQTLILNQLHMILAKVKYRTICILIFMLLCSLGIYIGRFLRFHSIHMFIDPLSVWTVTWESINMNSVLFMMWMFILQGLIYFLFAKKKGDAHVN